MTAPPAVAIITVTAGPNPRGLPPVRTSADLTDLPPIPCP